MNAKWCIIMQLVGNEWQMSAIKNKVISTQQTFPLYDRHHNNVIVVA